MEPLSKLFGKSKQAYYKYDENVVLRKVAREAFVIEYVRGIRAIDPGIGGPKLWLMYKREFGDNDTVGRDTFEDILDRNNLKVRIRIRKPKTTDSRHGLPTFPNLTKELIPTRPNQLWVSDITYIPIWVDDITYIFCYLSLILDAYTEEIIGCTSALHWRPFTLWKPLRWLSNALMASKRLTLSIIQTAAFSTPAAIMYISCKRTISRSV